MTDCETRLDSDGESSVEDLFDGKWNNRGVICGDVLTWQDGPATSLTITGRTTLKVTLSSKTYQGELRGDGRLHWDDGDIWSRQSCFDGLWRNRGAIDGDKLTWKDGPTELLVITSDVTLELTFEGHTYHGELREDGQLHWDDGDIWTRQELLIGDTIKAKAGQHFIDDGIDIFAAGDQGRITKVYETRTGQKVFDTRWKRTGKTSTYYLASWSNAFALALNPSRFGLSLFAQVEAVDHNRNLPQGEVGSVVGFNGRHVEVKLQRGIFRCLPRDLQERAATLLGGDSTIAATQGVHGAHVPSTKCLASVIRQPTTRPLAPAPLPAVAAPADVVDEGGGVALFHI